MLLPLNVLAQMVKIHIIYVSVIDMQESYPSENFMYVVLDLPPSCHGSSRTDVVTIETAPRSSNVPIAPANET